MIRLLKAFRNIFLEKTPMYVVFFVTSACNARCRMCFNWRNIDNASPSKELTLDEIKKIFSNFGNIQQLTLSGGEPFLRDDLAEIVPFISQTNDVQMVTFPTNGILTERIVRLTGGILDNIKPDTHIRLSLSIEGIGEKHDDIVQVKGAFGKIKETHRLLQQLKKRYRNLNADVALCVSAFNKNEAKDSLEYLSKNFPGSTVEVMLARGETRDASARSVSPEEYRGILDYFYLLKEAKKDNKPFAKLFDSMERIVNYQVIDILNTKKMPSKCYVYSKMIVIQSNGDVLPCEYLDKRLGNLRDNGYDIKKVLKKPENREIWRLIAGGNCYCTWECALINNLVCNPLAALRLAEKSFVRNDKHTVLSNLVK